MITRIQIETSTICNAACPQCFREDRFGDYSWFEQTYLPTEFYDRIPDEIYQQADLDFCGTLGDPCAAPNFLEVIEKIKTKNSSKTIGIATNGGMKTPEWWAKLGALLGPNDHVIFGIDGLEDLNHVYRVNVRWNKLMENIKAFIAAGGRANWQFIPFLHNQHQIEACKQLSKEMGFISFFTVENTRYILDAANGNVRYGANKTLLQQPSLPKYQSETVINFSPSINDYKSFRDATESGSICCESLDKKEMYIDVKGRLLPCCYLSGATHTLDPTDEWDGFYKFWTEHGGDKVSLFYHTWNEVLEADYYTALKETWTKKYGQGRLLVCSATCAKSEGQLLKYNTFKEEHE